MLIFLFPLREEHDVDLFFSSWRDLFHYPEGDLEKELHYLGAEDRKSIISSKDLSYKDINHYLDIIKPKISLIEDYDKEKYKFQPENVLGDENSIKSWENNQSKYHKLNRRHLEWSMSQYYKIYTANCLRNEYERISGVKYDVVIRLRPDLVFFDGVFNFRNSIFNDNTINTYNQHSAHYPGVNDPLFWGTPESINKASSTYIFLPKMFQDNIPLYGGENILYLTCQKHGLSIHYVPKNYVDRHRSNILCN